MTNTPNTTTDAGIPVSSDEHSLTVGADGPIVLHDHYLMEQMAAFNREMIPDRQPHAKGSGAFGRFEVTEDVSRWTKAKFLQPGTTTDMAVRFSTVAGESGSPVKCWNFIGSRTKKTGVLLPTMSNTPSSV